MATTCARERSPADLPVVEALPAFVARGGFVLGSCNGFQILCEAGLLPGALVRNECLQYRCQSTYLLVDNVETSFTRAMRQGQVLKMPISHGEGSYYAERGDAATSSGTQVRSSSATALKTAGSTKEANPNGSLQNIAGVDQRGRHGARLDAASRSGPPSPRWAAPTGR